MERARISERPRAEIYQFAIVAALFSPVLVFDWSLLVQSVLQKFDDSWLTAGWLINYSGGFVRRGLSGTIALWVADHIGIQPRILVGYFCLTVYFLWSALFVYQVARAKSVLLFIVVVSSPLVFSFNYVDNTILRKETLFFLLLSLCAIFPENQKRSFIAVASLAPVLILFHEAIFTWMPALIMLAWVRGCRHVVFMAWLTLGSLALFAVCLFNPGTTEAASHICASISEYHFDSDICSGAIAAIGRTATSYTGGRYLSAWVDSAALLSVFYILPLLIFVSGYIAQVRMQKVFLLTLFAMLIISLPLMYVSTDWGRWLRAFVIASLTLAMALNGTGGGGSRFRYSADLHVLLAVFLLTAALFVGVSNDEGQYFGFRYSAFWRISQVI